jgi:soluble lytic murein transglycosylase-like protein
VIVRGDTTPSTDCDSSELALIFPYRSGLIDAEDSLGLQREACICELAGSAAWVRSLRCVVRVVVAVAPFVCQIAVSALFEPSVRAQTVSRPAAIDRFAKFIHLASDRFAIPERWICAVLEIESGGDEHSISHRGAIGLMQLMPGTWVDISARYGLGLDPFDARDNIMAGTAYLKEMHDRFGSAGFLAAYHAGPRRYEQHLLTGKPLPSETTAYVAAVTPLLGDEQGEHAAVYGRRALPWREAPLFVERAGAP